MRQVSNKQHNWIIAAIWLLFMFPGVRAAKLIADGFGLEYTKHWSNADWWGMFVLMCLASAVLSVCIANILVDWLGPEIRIEDRIKEAKDRVAECERDLNDALHKLHQLENNANQ